MLDVVSSRGWRDELLWLALDTLKEYVGQLISVFTLNSFSASKLLHVRSVCEVSIVLMYVYVNNSQVRNRDRIDGFAESGIHKMAQATLKEASRQSLAGARR